MKKKPSNFYAIKLKYFLRMDTKIKWIKWNILLKKSNCPIFFYTKIKLHKF